jgi:outer membrane protein assembly factor BamB
VLRGRFHLTKFAGAYNISGGTNNLMTSNLFVVRYDKSLAEEFRIMKKISHLVVGFFVCFITVTCYAADWPQFRGPHRDGKSAETNLLKKWPENGPRQLWICEGLGEGYSSLSVADGLIYTTGMMDNQGVLFAFDLKGVPAWKEIYGPEWTKSFPGVRATPTIEGDRLYLMSGVGTVYCYEAKSGNRKWQVDTFETFKVGKYPSWGIAESVLIVDNKAICTPGGPDATMVALDKLTGQTVWTTKGLSEASSYCAPILVEWAGRKMVVNQTAESVIGVDAQNGKLLWQVKFSDYQGKHKSINPVTCHYHDGYIYATSGYDDGGILLKLSPDGNSVTQKWVDKTLDTHHGGVVVVDGYIYGSNWHSNSNGNWICLEMATGKVMYDTQWFNKGCLIFAEDMLYCYEESKGNFALVKADPSGFNPISTFQITQGSGKHWAHPVISHGVLYVRHGDVLMAYDIQEK